MKYNNYPNGWNGKPQQLDELSAKLILVVNSTNSGLNYKDAAKRIDKIMEKKDVVGNE